MVTRIIVSTAAFLLLVSIAFSQMKYGRANPAKPTPTPTPTPTPQQRGATAYPQIPARQSPTPPQRTMQATTQPKPTPMPAQIQPKQLPPARTATSSIPPKALPAPAPMVAKPTPTPVPPPDIKAYLDKQLASSKDQKFHLNANGKDIALTPFHFWRQKSTGFNTTSTSVSMRSDEGRVYDIDFLTTGKDVTGIQVRRINGEAVR